MTTNKQHYDNPASRRERRKVAENDRRVRNAGTTYHEITAAEADVVAGRYAQVSRTAVTGVSPVGYPTLPTSSPWHHDPVPAEGPLGFSADDQPPTGEFFEVAQSLGEARNVTLVPPSQAHECSNGEAQTPPSGILPADALRQPRRLFSKRKKG